MKVLIVEDEFLLREATEEILQRRLPGVAIECVSTEREFRESLPRWSESPPSVVIMDIKLQWQALTSDRIPAPEDVREEGNRRAGLRCHEFLRTFRSFDHTHVIFYSVFLTPALKAEIEGLGDNTSYLEKGHQSSLSGSAFTPLVDRVKQHLK